MEIQKNLFDYNYEDLKVFLNKKIGIEENKLNKVHCKLIELNRKKAELAADSLERTVILHGDGLNLNLLEEANIGQANALLALKWASRLPS